MACRKPSGGGMGASIVLLKNFDCGAFALVVRPLRATLFVVVVPASLLLRAPRAQYYSAAIVQAEQQKIAQIDAVVVCGNNYLANANLYSSEIVSKSRDSG
jgi:hypothetical protein